MSVGENLSFGLNNIKLDSTIINQRINQVASILQLAPLLERKPQNLSGGQRQRVAIGRAIVQQPKVFLFDEPLSNLDAALRVQMRQELSKLHKTLNSTIVYVTHDQVEAMTLASRIVILNGGKIEQLGTPLEVYNTPHNLFVAEFMGAPKINLIPLKAIDKIAKNSAELTSRVNIWRDKGITDLGVRPEKITIEGSKDISIEANCNFSELLGDSTVLYTTNSDIEIRVKLPYQYSPSDNQSINMAIAFSDLLFFNAAGKAIYF